MINVVQKEICESSVIFEISNFTGTIWGYELPAASVEIINKDINNVLNELLHYDDINIVIDGASRVFKKADYEYRLTESEIRRFKYQPFAHQVDAINFGLRDKRTK